ncbi:MAG: fatty acid desaturase, partial [Bdellovibrionota bacterium]
MSQANVIKELSKPRLGRFLLSLAGDWCGIAAGFALFGFFPSVYSFVAASVIIGIYQHGLVVLGHEAVHFNVCRSRDLNEWVGRLFCFFPIGMTVSTYRDFHFPHHKQPNDASDPEVPVRRAMGKNWNPPFSLRRGFALWAFSFIGGSLKELGIFMAHMPRGSLKEKAYLGVFWAAAITAAVIGGHPIYLGLWFFAQATTYFSVVRIRAWFEHSLSGTHTNRFQIPNYFYRALFPHNTWVHF